MSPIESAFSLWRHDEAMCSLQSDPRLWHLPEASRRDVLRLYAWIAIPCSVLAVPSLLVFPFANFTLLWELHEWKQFAAAVTFAFLAIFGSALIYFWPLLLSLRRPHAFSAKPGFMQYDRKIFSAGDGYASELTMKRYKTRMLVNLEIKSGGKSALVLTFSESSFAGLEVFFKQAHKISGVPYNRK